MHSTNIGMRMVPEYELQKHNMCQLFPYLLNPKFPKQGISFNHELISNHELFPIALQRVLN